MSERQTFQGSRVWQYQGSEWTAREARTRAAYSRTELLHTTVLFAFPVRQRILVICVSIVRNNHAEIFRKNNGKVSPCSSPARVVREISVMTSWFCLVIREVVRSAIRRPFCVGEVQWSYRSRRHAERYRRAFVIEELYLSSLSDRSHWRAFEGRMLLPLGSDSTTRWHHQTQICAAVKRSAQTTYVFTSVWLWLRSCASVGCPDRKHFAAYCCNLRHVPALNNQSLFCFGGVM